MKSKDYKAIQDAQLRYETYVQCRRFDLIVETLLSKSDSVCFSHSDLNEPIRGRENVLAFYRQIGEHFEKNGGFLRTDLSASQVIEFSPDGRSATGTWLTMGAVCKMGAYGKQEPPYALRRVFGQRHTTFVFEDGSWRMKDISWKKMCDLGPVPYDPQKCTGWSGLRERRWELPPTEAGPSWKGERGR